MEPFRRLEQIIDGNNEVASSTNSGNDSNYGYPTTEAAVNAGEYDLNRAVLRRI